jgi:hypothetical protein
VVAGDRHPVEGVDQHDRPLERRELLVGEVVGGGCDRGGTFLGVVQPGQRLGQS